MGSIKHINDLILNSQEKSEVHSFHQVSEELVFGQLFSQFAPRILFDKDGREVMGTGSALCPQHRRGKAIRKEAQCEPLD